jgi:hypothetical protein
MRWLILLFDSNARKSLPATVVNQVQDCGGVFSKEVIGESGSVRCGVV